MWNTIECLHSLGYASDVGSSENGVPMRSTLETKNWPDAAGLFFCQTRRVATRHVGSFSEPANGPFAKATFATAMTRTGSYVRSVWKDPWSHPQRIEAAFRGNAFQIEQSIRDE